MDAAISNRYWRFLDRTGAALFIIRPRPRRPPRPPGSRGKGRDTARHRDYDAKPAEHKAFLPDGKVDSFEGNYFWKMQPDVQLPIQAPVFCPLSKPFVQPPEKYGNRAGPVKNSGSLPGWAARVARASFAVRKEAGRIPCCM